jgi:hypothetical protein
VRVRSAIRARSQASPPKRQPLTLGERLTAFELRLAIQTGGARFEPHKSLLEAVSLFEPGFTPTGYRPVSVRISMSFLRRYDFGWRRTNRRSKDRIRVGLARRCSAEDASSIRRPVGWILKYQQN